VSAWPELRTRARNRSATYLRSTTELRDLVESDSEAELLTTGFEFTEVPAWNERTQRLHFSDIPGDSIHTWGGEQVAVWGDQVAWQTVLRLTARED